MDNVFAFLIDSCLVTRQKKKRGGEEDDGN